MSANINSLANVSDAKKREVVTEAALSAARILGISDAALSEILGISATTLSRGRKSKSIFGTNRKAFETAILFVRIYRSLEAFAGSDNNYMKRWLKAQNTVLHGAPLELMKTITGIVDVLNYLDGARARI